jgi:hypothetical protein
MSRFLLACDTLRRRYNCTILIVDFGGLGYTHGAMALKDAIDTEYRLERSGDKHRAGNYCLLLGVAV